MNTSLRDTRSDDMLTEEERRRLTSHLAESIEPLTAVLKCVVGLLTLLLVAAGPWTFLTAGGPSSAGVQYVAAQVDRVVAESRRVFEQRRRDHDTARHNRTASPSNTVTGPRLSVD